MPGGEIHNGQGAGGRLRDPLDFAKAWPAPGINGGADGGYFDAAQ
jgi:hypothetical protein